MAALSEDLDQASSNQQAQATQSVRKAQVGSGMRGDKRRTYRFQEGRVFDHATGRTAQLDRVMGGDFDRLWE